ncbi:uncharacterized protein si:ch73-100l22.3 [Scomber scombrus]|uniref:Uncharacterized protein si:ch73-100l22.3 n=1 Tax=Scomber scombrus TaxID=13677 RepID=A0AAV1PP79_SCOSC
MEDYDNFVQHRLSQLSKSDVEEEHKPSAASSFIRFYGQPILPPLLSGEQRDEMLRHRDAAQKAAAHRKFKDNQRMAYVQTILHSVQLRNTPTLEELLQESEIKTKSSYSHNINGGSVSHSSFSIGTKDSLSLFSPPVSKGEDGVSLPPLSSTTYSAFFTSNVTPQTSYQEGCLIDHHDSQQLFQPSSLNGESHQSVSSGYVTYENAENTTSVSERVYTGRESHGFGSMEGADDMGGFFLHNTSNTITKMPDIISHPPIDGEELERSGLESSFCNHFILVEDNCTSFQEDAVTCDYFPGEKSETSHLDSTESEADLPSTTVLDLDKDGNLDRIEVPVSSLDNGDFSDNPELSQTLNSEQHVQHDWGETEPADNQSEEEDSKLCEQHYRLSLQALLKKSQEYRRRQRMLRSQARNIKIQERAQEQPRVEEQSLSDKENDEFPFKGTVIPEGKKTKEMRGTFIPSVETSPKKSFENERMIGSELTGKRGNCKSESTHLIGDGNMKEMTSAEEETTLINNKLNISQEVITEPKQINNFLKKQSVSSETSPVQESFYLTSEQSTGLGKFCTIPAPNFCRSPVHCRGRASIKGGEAKTSKGKVYLNNSLNEVCKVEDGNLGDQNCQSTAVQHVVEGDVTSVLAKSSQHIDQLESNLSSLKVLISDLESTLTENLENSSQTESNLHSDVCLEGVKHTEQIKDDKYIQLGQSDCDYWEDKLTDDGDSSDAERDQMCREWPRRQSSDNCKNMHEDSGPEPSISDTDDISLILQEEGKEAVHLTELRLVKTLTTERKKEKVADKEGLTQSYGQPGFYRKQTQAKCILSAAQQMRIPDVFRNAPSETLALHHVSILSDTSNHPVERRNEPAVEGHDSTRSPSLNQSYDVDTPSGLWLLEGSASDLGSKGQRVQEKNLTPESGGEGQGWVSKVKRRLLMHLTEDGLDRSADTSRGADSDVRPNSSTPRAAVRWSEGHGHQKDKQEQLKQAHAAQVRALQEEHRRQQEELLQALAARYHLLQSVSLPCSMSSSRLGDTVTFSTLSQPSSSLPERCRPLLLAAAKGFLTRRLLRTDRVAQLVRTIGDTQQFLQAFQQQSPGRGGLCSRQDLLLQERVTLQLRAARYELYDVFFSLSAEERMQLISWDRELERERELKRQSGHTHQPRGKSSLSAATQKSLERKRGMMIQKKAAERHRGVVTRTGLKTGFSTEQPLETKRGQFRANPQRVPKSTYSSRPR